MVGGAVGVDGNDADGGGVGGEGGGRWHSGGDCAQPVSLSGKPKE